MLYTSTMQTAYRIGKTEGPASLWKGGVPALLRQCSYTGLTWLLYTPIRSAVAGDVPVEEVGRSRPATDRGGAWRRAVERGVASAGGWLRQGRRPRRGEDEE